MSLKASKNTSPSLAHTHTLCAACPATTAADTDHANWVYSKGGGGEEEGEEKQI